MNTKERLLKEWETSGVPEGARAAVERVASTPHPIARWLSLPEEQRFRVIAWLIEDGQEHPNDRASDEAVAAVLLALEGNFAWQGDG